MFKSLCLVKLHTFLPYGGALLVQKKQPCILAPFITNVNENEAIIVNEIWFFNQ